jgi:hypothetical protein
MEPPLDHLEHVVLLIKEVLSTRSTDPQIQSFGKMTERLENEGHAAHSTKDRKTWIQINSTLENLLRRLERPAKDEQDHELLPTILQKLFAYLQLDQTRQLLRTREMELMQQNKFDRMQGRLNRVREDIDRVETAIDQIDDNSDPKAVQSQLQLLFLQKVKSIEDQILTLGVDVGLSH